MYKFKFKYVYRQIQNRHKVDFINHIHIDDDTNTDEI